jgi:thymidylate kinase
MSKNKQINKELKEVINLFIDKDLKYNLFKCEHIFKGENSNLDILFLNDKDFCLASKLLENKGYKIYMSEKVEKYKIMYVCIKENVLYSIHLHKQVAWHGIVTLNKEKIFSREIKSNNYFIPSYEDSLLIHSAHILFENYKCSEHQKNLIKALLNQKLDLKYIDEQLKKNHWKRAFYQFINIFKKGKQLPFSIIIRNYLRLMLVRPLSGIYFAKKVILSMLRKINIRRKGCLIALIGVNGSGKTTMVKNLTKTYKPITNFFSGQFGYYFGWDPFLKITKVFSKKLKSKNSKIFEDMNKKPKFSVKQELILIYNYIEYLFRYLFIIRPKLTKNKLVIADRFFYDIYAQYKYSEVSLIANLLLSIYPKPNYLFVLDANLDVIMNRDKDPNVQSKTVSRSKERNLHTRNDLLSQKRKYQKLMKRFYGEKINTEKPINQNIKLIISKTFGCLLR